MPAGPIIRLLVILLVAGSMLGAPFVVAPAIAAVAQADDKKNDDGKNDKDDKDKDKKDRNEKKDKEQKGAAEVSGTEGYMVSVDCLVDEATTTTCTFTGTAPEGASDVGHVQLPAEAVCTEVIAGEYEYVDPDPNTRITGYKSRRSEGSFTLVLAGEVRPAGTTIYWFKTGDGVFPGVGPGLQCGPLAEAPPASLEAGDEMPAGTPAAMMSNGELVISVYTCASVPADTESFDWFGACDPASTGYHFVLELLSPDAAAPATTDSDQSGQAVFDDLEAGLYSLEMTDVDWCHATSDNVNPNGKVIIEQGGRTTVWLFICESES